MTELQNPWRPLLSPNLRSCSNLPKPIARKFACDFPGIKNINNTGNSNGANNAILCKSNIRHMENGWKMDEHCQLDDRFVNLPKKVVDSYGSFNHGFSHGFPLYDLRLQSLAKPGGPSSLRATRMLSGLMSKWTKPKECLGRCRSMENGWNPWMWTDGEFLSMNRSSKMMILSIAFNVK